MADLLSTISSFPLAFGGAALSGAAGGYGFGKSEDPARLLAAAYAAGMRIFDAAPVYGFGAVEQHLGRAFKKMREKVFLISKSGVFWHANRRIDLSNDPQITQKMLEQSLRDFASDYIDLYMIHWPDKKVDIRRPLEVLVKAQKQGKIKHLGLANTNLADLNLAQEVALIEVVQNEFSLLAREAEELFPYLQQHQISFMSWGTLGKGIISGRVTPARNDYDEHDCRRKAFWWKQTAPQRMQVMQPVLAWLKTTGYSGLELALGFNLSAAKMHCLLGLKTVQDLQQAQTALAHLPPPEIIAQGLAILRNAEEKMPKKQKEKNNAEETKQKKQKN